MDKLNKIKIYESHGSTIISWLGIIITAISLAIFAVGVNPAITKIIRKDIYQAQTDLNTLYWGGRIKGNYDDLKIILVYGFSLNEIPDEWKDKEIMIRGDYGIVYPRRRINLLDRLEHEKRVFVSDKETINILSCRSIMYNVDQYVSNWKDHLALNFGILGLTLIIISQLLSPFMSWLRKLEKT